MRTLFAAALWLALSVAPAIADAPDARDLLARVARTYQQMDTYLFQGSFDTRISAQGKSQDISIPVVAAAAGPGRNRTEMRHPMMGLTIVSDGDSTTTYMAQSNTYTRKPVVMPLGADSAHGVSSAPEGSPLARYANLLAGLKDAKVAGEESIELGGVRHDVWVVEAEFAIPQPGAETPPTAQSKFWIDRDRLIVLRDSNTVTLEKGPMGTPISMVQTSTYAVAQVGGTVPDSFFVFTPPAGASAVADFTAPGQQPSRSGLQGKPAADFTLADLKGRSRKLSSYKGKVVMLDFWATWCGPCRITMPHVNKLHNEFKSKGLVVLGVNVGETAKVVKPYLTRNKYTFDVLLDSKSEVARQYQATGIPTTVIIGKDGVISTYMVGAHPEADFREALKKAGIE